MPAYIVLGKFTKQGADRLAELPELMKRAIAMGEERGIRTIGAWLTMGQYDLVSVFEAPDEGAAAAWAMQSVKWGDITTQTLRAFSEEEFAEIVAKLP